MREPLEAAKKEMEELRKRAENYEKEKALLAVRFISPMIARKIVIDEFFFSSEHQASIEELRSRFENFQVGIRSSVATLSNRKVFSLEPTEIEELSFVSLFSDRERTRRSLQQIRQGDQRSSTEEQLEKSSTREETQLFG